MEKTRICKNCGKEFELGKTICPFCYKKQGGTPKWVIIICVIFGLFVLVGLMSDETKENGDKDEYKKNKEVKVEVTDFSNMTEVEIDSWCKTNKINCDIKEVYSDTVEKSKVISQSVESGKEIYEGNNLTINISLGKEPTKEEISALKSAETYSEYMNMSKQAIYDQLVSEYGGKFKPEEAQYAIDNINADWNKNALESAKTYREYMNMSKQAIYDQLVSSYGGKFRPEEAQYAIDHLDD